MDYLIDCTECIDHTLIYVSEISPNNSFNPLDNDPKDLIFEFVGAYVGCIIGKAINKVLDKDNNNTYNKKQINNLSNNNNLVNIDEYIDTIVTNINDGDYIAHNEIYIGDKKVELSHNTIDIINNKLKDRTIQNIKLFNDENKKIIKYTQKHLDLAQKNKELIDEQIVKYDNFTKHNPINIEKSLKTFADVMDEKNSQYFLESGYHTHHNVLPKPKMQTIKCHGEGKLGNFIFMIPIITIPIGGGSGGGSGCIIL